jgi:flavin-dependent dehydrogenase
VLIVGGGPAGSSCARDLVRAGLDVVLADSATFPRHKPCAGWITPEVAERVDLDLQEYGREATLQPILGFDTGAIGGPRVLTRYERPVSFAIRRCEFDTHLLRRCGAQVLESTRISGIERVNGRWRANEDIEARMLVGAGGHFCPVARLLGRGQAGMATVAAQEVEFQLQSPGSCPVASDVPEIYFSRDLRGYGWCVRKGAFLNVGVGRLGANGLPDEARAFLSYLVHEGRVPPETATRWHGHVYLVRAGPPPRLIDDGVLLVGDAAGLAYPASGEGILPAVVSGQLAARAIANAAPDFTGARLAGYEEALSTRLGPRGALPGSEGAWARARTWAGRLLLASPWFARHVLVPRRLLHRP